MARRFFRIPFASGGTLNPVPDVDPGNGSTNYTEGYGPDYSLNPGTCIFQGQIAAATSVLTVTTVTQGILGPGSAVSGAGVTAGETIVSNGTGTGGVGTYNITNVYGGGIGSESMTALANPSALLLDRGQMNQLFNDITLAIQAMQEFYAPQWITSADNGGAPYAYANGALVLFTDGNVWQSIVAANTATPGTDATKWIIFLSNYATSVALAAEATARIAGDNANAAAIAAETARAEGVEAAIEAQLYVKAIGTCTVAGLVVSGGVNIASFVKNSVGNYTVNFNAAFASTVYQVAITILRAAGANVSCAIVGKAVGSFTVEFNNVTSGAPIDPDGFDVIATRFA